jgi:prephenate dehydrogenase
MIVTVIGIGLIGGSIAIDLREQGFATKIIGVETNFQYVVDAVQMDIIDDQMPLKEGVQQADLVVIAVPVNTARNLISEVLQHLKSDAVVVDMGSTKAGICSVIEDHPKRKQFVASHPIAGTENKGLLAAFSGLFVGKVAIICEQEKSSGPTLKIVQDMYAALGMKLIYMDAKGHDLHMAYVSHLSHISSFTLGLTVLEIEKNEKNIFDTAGSGLASTVRLAKSSPDMWAPIFEQNAEHLSDALGAYISNLTQFKQLIDEGKIDQTHALMTQANDIRRVLDGIDQNK